MTRASMLALIAGLMVLTGVGCGDGGGSPQAAVVAFTGTVTGPDGKPLKDVRLNLSPIKTGLPSSYKLGGDGKFSGQVVPGKYMFSFESLDGKAAGIKSIPDSYHSPSADHTVEVGSSGGEVSIAVGR